MAPLGQAFHEDKEISKYLVDCPVEHTSLTIAESKIANLGSGLVTNSIIEPGRQIFKSKPLLAVVDYRFDTICHYCLKGSEKVPLAEGPTEEPRPKVCSACRRVRFCSKACHAKAWTLFHRDECKLLRESPNMVMSHLALCRLLFWQKTRKLTDKVARVLSLLEDHFDEYSDTEAGDVLFEFASSIRNTANPSVALNVVLRLLPAIQINAIKMRQAEKNGTFGIALDLLSCAINHSCAPNAFLFVEDGHIIARSLRQIPIGEEITISYGDPMLPLKSRREYLKAEYFFHCFCKRCESDKREQKAMVGNTIHTIKGLRDAQEMMMQLINNTVVATHKPGRHKEFESVEKMEINILTVARQALKQGNWPEHLDPMPLVRNTLAWLYLNKQDHFAAARNSLRGTLMCRYRNSPEWVNNLCALTQCLAAIAAGSPDAPYFSSGSFLTLKETQCAVRGYGMRLCKDAGTIFGGKSKYTEFLCDWFSWIVKTAECPKPGSAEFEAVFYEVQKKLLAWADIDVAYCIQLGSPVPSLEGISEGLKKLKIVKDIEDSEVSEGDDDKGKKGVAGTEGA